MKRINTALLALCCLSLLSCKEERAQQKHAPEVKSIATPIPETDLLQPVKLINPQEEVLEGFTFRYGFTAYDKDESINPAYMEVLRGNKVIFKDSFDADGELFMVALGKHKLDGDKFVFTLHHGTEACDYTQTARYYLADRGKFTFLNKYWSATGGDHYATRYFKHIFPEDSLGKPNTLTIVEGMTYHEQDQPNIADTTYIVFAGKSFKMHKLSNDLGKEE